MLKENCRLLKMRTKYGYFFIFFKNGKQVGRARVSDLGTTLWDFQIYPKFRKKGLGAKFMTSLMKNRNHPKRLYARSFYSREDKRLTNRKLIKFYKNFGFRLVRKNDVGTLMKLKSN